MNLVCNRSKKWCASSGRAPRGYWALLSIAMIVACNQPVSPAPPALATMSPAQNGQSTQNGQPTQTDAPTAIEASSSSIASGGAGMTASQDACVPNCNKRVCGSDGCGGTCGTCDARSTCDEPSGRCMACKGPSCICVPSCDRKICGKDGCDGSCGDCDPGQYCDGDGRCRQAVCGNGMVEGDEECDGGDLCGPTCKRLTARQVTCMSIPTVAAPECLACSCQNCTQETLGCYLSGDTKRDAACRELSECGNKNKCATVTDCVCGEGNTQCRSFNGPCVQQVRDLITQSGIGPAQFQTCIQDPDCSLARATAFSACILNNCSQPCLGK